MAEKAERAARRPRGVDNDAGFEGIGITDDLMFKQVFGEDVALARHLLELATGEDVGEVDFVRASEETRPEWDARESVVVFVCTFDPLSTGLRRYTVRRYVEETGDPFPDRQRGILHNAKGENGEVPEDLEFFMRYVSGYHGEEVLANDFVRDVDAQVRATRADWEWRRVWMNMQEKLYDAREEGREEGHAEGLEEGTLETLAKLVAKGLLSIEDAAANLGVTLDAIREEMERVRA